MAITPNLSAILSHVMGGDFGVKMGPGVLLVIGRVAIAALGAIVILLLAFDAPPEYVLGAIVLIIGLVVYFCERAIRYARENPIPALMGGAELLKLIEHQMAARDETIIGDDTPQLGAAKDAANAITTDEDKA